jgi:hypothetical protein
MAKTPHFAVLPDKGRSGRQHPSDVGGSAPFVALIIGSFGVALQWISNGCASFGVFPMRRDFLSPLAAAAF